MFLDRQSLDGLCLAFDFVLLRPYFFASSLIYFRTVSSFSSTSSLSRFSDEDRVGSISSIYTLSLVNLSLSVLLRVLLLKLGLCFLVLLKAIGGHFEPLLYFFRPLSCFYIAFVVVCAAVCTTDDPSSLFDLGCGFGFCPGQAFEK